MSDYYIGKIIDMVVIGLEKKQPKQELIDDIDKMLSDNWVGITGYDDE